MLTKILLDNFLSFKHIEFNLLGANKIPKNLAIIYGANGSGKTNLMSSIMFLKNSINTFNNYIQFNEANEQLEKIKTKTIESLLNDNIPLLSFKTDGFQQTNIINLAKQTVMIGSKEVMSLKYEFKINNVFGYYHMEFLNNELINEVLSYKINKRSGILYQIKKNNEKIDPILNKKIFSRQISEDLQELVEKYWGKHTFLAIIDHTYDLYNKDYIFNHINNNLIDVLDYFMTISAECKGKYGIEKEGFHTIANKILGKLSTGSINHDNINTLKTIEKALNDYFIRLYNDIDSVYYKITEDKEEIRYTLYIRKIINDNIINVPINEESTGTKKVLELFSLFYECTRNHTVVIDEMDTGIHDLLVSHIITEIKDTITGQLIITTHNTMLLEKIDPSNIYILHNDTSEKSINTIKDINIPPQKNHNHRIRYLSGIYGGIPDSVSLDINTIFEDIDSDSENNYV